MAGNKDTVKSGLPLNRIQSYLLRRRLETLLCRFGGSKYFLSRYLDPQGLVTSGHPPLVLVVHWICAGRSEVGLGRQQSPTGLSHRQARCGRFEGQVLEKETSVTTSGWNSDTVIM